MGPVSDHDLFLLGIVHPFRSLYSLSSNVQGDESNQELTDSYLDLTQPGTLLALALESTPKSRNK